MGKADSTAVLDGGARQECVRKCTGTARTQGLRRPNRHDGQAGNRRSGPVQADSGTWRMRARLVTDQKVWGFESLRARSVETDDRAPEQRKRCGGLRRVAWVLRDRVDVSPDDRRDQGREVWAQPICDAVVDEPGQFGEQRVGARRMIAPALSREERGHLLKQAPWRGLRCLPRDRTDINFGAVTVGVTHGRGSRIHSEWPVRSQQRPW